MSDNERNFAPTTPDAAPDRTIKLTDAELSKEAAKAQENLEQLRNNEVSDDEAEEFCPTPSSPHSISSFGGLFSFFQHSLLPDFVDHEQTEVTNLLDSTRTDLDFKFDSAVDISPSDYDKLPPLDKQCELKEVFAEGGQARISRGSDKTLHRSIAVKTLRREIQEKPALRKAFINEALITAQLEHPAIVPIHGLFKDDQNGIHQTMKLVKGHTLREELHRFKSLMLKKTVKVSQGVMTRLFNERVALLIKVCDAVAYAHSHDIIHCDLKPENIMIGEYGEVYVMDWGLARRFRDRQGRPVQVPSGAALDGTPRYMPAETFMGKPRDERTDIFALGLILFEMVTAFPAYSGRTIQEVIRKIKNGERNPVVNRFGYVISPDLKAIIEKASNYYPEDRYKHVADFSNDLRRYLEGLAVSARPENLVGKFFRGIRRYSRTLVLMTLVSWIICGFFITRHLRHLNAKAQNELKDERANLEIQMANNRQLELERRLSAMDTKTIRSAIRISNKLVELSSHLGHLSVTAGALLSGENDGSVSTAGMLPILQYRKITTQNATFSPVYNDYIKPEVCTYQVPRGRNHDQIAEELKRLQPITRELQRLVLNSSEENRKNLHDMQNYMLVQEGLLVRHAYIGVNDTHLHIAFPGTGGYPDDYDNHAREWYAAARLQADRFHESKPVWGRPYLDTGKKQQVLTCSMPVLDQKQQFLGVVAFDLFFETFSDQLRNDGNGQGAEIVEKFLCTDTGVVLCYVPVHPMQGRENRSIAELEGNLRQKLAFLLQNSRQEANGGYGHYRSQDFGHAVFYHYAYIPGLNLYLIEKSSEEELYKQVEVTGRLETKNHERSLPPEPEIEGPPPIPSEAREAAEPSPAPAEDGTDLPQDIRDDNNE